MFESHLKQPLNFPTLTGSIVTFNSQYAGLPLKSHSVEVVASQSGSGTPSPSNPRPITGYSAINISHSDADTSNPTVYTIPIGSTVYGGEYDARTGVLTVTHKIKSIDSSSQINHGEGTNVFYINDFFDTADDTETTDCNYFVRAERNYYTIANVQTYMEDKAFACAISVNRLFIKNIDWSSLSDFLTWLGSGHIDIAIKLATPQTIQLTAQQIETLLGENNIWADTGNTTLQYIKLG